jgi:hypothetical protein
MTSLTQLREVLDGANELYTLLPLQDGAKALLTQRGARVLGLFPSVDSANLFWNNAALDALSTFSQFVDNGDWNLGGERCWIAPEIQYNARDRRDFFGTLSVPADIDPGRYVMSMTPGAVTFRQRVTLTAHNLATGSKSLDVQRTVRPATNPFAASSHYAQLMEGVRYFGYEQTAVLTELDAAAIHSEIWNLVQVNAGGTLIIPVAGAVDASDYFGDVPAEARVSEGGSLRLSITGKRQFKVGYKAACMTGRMAYWTRHADGIDTLLVRQFFNNPSALYAEEPPAQIGLTGHSVHVYNDDGVLGAGTGGFGEMECSGQTIGGHTGRSSSTDTFLLWGFTGKTDALRPIALALLGVTL